MSRDCVLEYCNKRVLVRTELIIEKNTSTVVVFVEHLCLANTIVTTILVCKKNTDCCPTQFSRLGDLSMIDIPCV